MKTGCEFCPDSRDYCKTPFGSHVANFANDLFFTREIQEKKLDKFFSAEEMASIKPFQFPQHVAIIMDGNRRWAKRNGLPSMAGHFRGAETLTLICRASLELGIKVLTVFAFSTENWKRTQIEIKGLLRLLQSYLLRQRKMMVDEGIKLSVIGDISRFPKDICKALQDTMDATCHCNKLNLVIALNYGSRDEMKRAICKIVDDCLANRLSKEKITEEVISSYLDTSQWKDPDLLIRTSGESRLSNFLLWQISYSEVVVTEKLWPDFCEKDLYSAILEYQKREVRIGK